MSVALPIVSKPSSIGLPLITAVSYTSEPGPHSYVHAILHRSLSNFQPTPAKLQLTLWYTSYCHECQQHIAGRAGQCRQIVTIVLHSHSGNNIQVQIWCSGYSRGTLA